MSKTVSLAVMILLLCAQAAQADGIPAYYDEHGWHLLSENSQYAVVSLKDGRETMLLQVALSGESAPEQAEKLVWITPVPAPPSKVKVDILRGFPAFEGVRPTGKLGAELRTLLGIMAATQIYPVVLIMTMPHFLGASGREGVAIHQRVRRDGVELELVGAESSQALADHLKSLGVDLPAQGLDKLSRYTGQDNCLVVYRIVDFKSYRDAVSKSDGRILPLGVEVSFPAQKGFFPLVASSALPGDLRISVAVPGFVSAEDPVPPGLETHYFLGQMRAGPEVHKSLGIREAEDVRYTRFWLSAAPEELTQDLVFSSGAPVGVWLAEVFLSLGVIAHILTGLLFFVLLSILSVLIAAPLWPREALPSGRDFVKLGLSNLATLIGLIFAARSLARKVGSSPKRATLFAIIVSLTFVFMLAGLGFLSFRL